MAFQFRRGTDAERQSITPKTGEPLYVTDTGQVYVGDGTTQGGLLVSAAVSDDDSPSLGGNLDLNGNDIIGTGNININGFITATGNINLGDGAEDNVIVGGVISSSLIPSQDGRYDLGDNLSSWRNGFFEGVEVDGELKANSLQIKSIELDDSTTVYDGETQSLFVESAFANVFEGNLLGSLYSEDSSIIIDQQTRTIFSDEQFIGNIKLSSDDGTIFRVGSQETPIECYIHSDSSGIGVGIFGETETFPGNTPNLSMQAFRGTLDNSDSVQDGDSLGLITFGGYNGQDFTMGAFISATVDDQTFSTGDNFDTKITIGSLSGIANNKTVSINSEGQLTSKILTTGGFETSNLPTGPDVGVGSIVFDTITSQFKGWNGTDWIVLG